MMNSNYLLVLLLTPFICSLVIGLTRGRAAGWLSVALAAAYFLICLVGFPTETIRFKATWFEPLGLSYSLLLDPYAYWLILLSALLTLLSVAYSKSVVTEKVPAYHSLFHALQGTVVACLLCDDLIFFYVFWEAMLIPMYFIIGIWGGQRRIYSAMKFFLYTFAGSLFMLVGLISLYVLYFQKTGSWTASFEILREFFHTNPIEREVQIWIFLSMLISFAIKVPLFPFHTWLPDAHVEAPTAGSVILAGVLLKMGTYGLMRFAVPLFPEAAVFFSPWVCLLSVIGIILGALIAWRQTDIKKLVAYSSVSHLGFVTLGIFMMTEAGWNGAYLQMLNHGISTGALFFLIGFLYDQRHTRDINAYGGLAKILPAYSVVFLIFTLSSVALPGTNGFVGEFLILVGSFQSKVGSVAWVLAAGTGVVLGAIYMLHLAQKLLYGKPSSHETETMTDLTIKEWLIYSPLIVLVFWIGVYPEWILSSIRETTATIFTTIPTQFR